MLRLRPDEPDLEHLRSLVEAIDDMCEVLDGERGAVIESLTEILRRRTEFEVLRRSVNDVATDTDRA